jgi:hypothetical protein
MARLLSGWLQTATPEDDGWIPGGVEFTLFDINR